jgi:hypothetical protein
MMSFRKIPYLFVAVSALLTGNQAAFAEDSGQNVLFNSYDENAVSNLLLAAGMYGDFDANSSGEVNLSLKKDMLKGMFSEQGQFDGQDITFSYTGSEGRLGFSAGYIYTAVKENKMAETILLGMDEYGGRNTLDNIGERPWYFTLDLSRSFQVSEDLAVGIGSKAVLLTNNLNDEENGNKAVAMSLNLPVSYKGFMTITPEVQWSRTVDGGQGTVSDLEAFADPDAEKNAFYGGMSISFSY